MDKNIHYSLFSNLCKRNAVFIMLSLILVIVLGLALVYIPKGELHLLLCDRHTPARDIFYKYYTQMAEWLPYVICVSLLLFGRVGNGLLATSCVVMSGLTTQIVKHIVNAPRPLTWFAENLPDIQLPLVEGVRMNQYFSFPSGHTTTFFSLFFAISIIATNYLIANNSERSGSAGSPGTKGSVLCQRNGIYFVSAALQLLLFMLAALGGYSRIYLSQHFAQDVFGGIIVGLLISMVCYAIFMHFMDRKWYNYRLLVRKKA